jgi:hypothetical protein
MSIGDLVMFPPAVDAGVGSQPTTLGVVVAEAGGPPAVADVMWQSTGKVTFGIPQTTLRKVFVGAFYDSLNVGTWQQVGSYPELGDGTPKSPAASGLLLDAFMLGDYDAADPDEDVTYARITTNNGDSTLLTAEDPGGDGQEASTPPSPSIKGIIPGRRNS